MMDVTTWREQLVDELRSIGDRRDLESLWSGENPNAISSYQEEVAHVFSDFDINGFLLLSPDQSGLTPSQFHALRRFRDEFANFVDDMNREQNGAPDYRTVLVDPRWEKITSLARAFIALIDEHA